MEKNNIPPLLILDSNVLISLLRKDDSLHQHALKIAKKLEKTGAIFITNNYLIAEALTVLLLRTKSLKAPLHLGRLAYEKTNPWFKVYDIEINLQKEAWQIFKNQKPSNQLSFSDCTLPVLGKKLGTKTIFSFDVKLKLFKKMGLEILS